MTACAVWRAGRTGETPPQTFSPTPNVVCFEGDITASSARHFLQVVSLTEGDGPLSIVVDSFGGNTDEAMSMGESILKRDAIVIVDGICASSCANYLFVAADRRVLAPGSMLVFHGGVAPIDRDELRDSLSGQVPEAQVETTLDSLEQQIARQIERQDALLRAAGVDVDLFRWMAGIFANPPRLPGVCQVDGADAVVFSNALLALHGVAIEEGHGPGSDAEIEELLEARGLSRRICLIDAL